METTEMMVNVAQQDDRNVGENQKVEKTDNYFHLVSSTSFKIPGIISYCHLFCKESSELCVAVDFEGSCLL